MMRILGIDPGLTGALALVEVLGERVVGHARMPTRPGPAKRRKIDVYRLFDILNELDANGVNGIVGVVLESPSAMPRQGVASAFGFGRSVGVVEGLLVYFGKPVELVPPAWWKRVLKVPAAKDGARARATELMPNDRALWARASDDGIAEAALLALWGARAFAGQALMGEGTLFQGRIEERPW